jgi:hypothetical protein
MASGSKNDIFGIDDAGEFKRPAGTLANCTCRPGDTSPGYSHVSLRDKPLNNDQAGLWLFNLRKVRNHN